MGGFVASGNGHDRYRLALFVEAAAVLRRRLD